jgi:hypothetical protein
MQEEAEQLEGDVEGVYQDNPFRGLNLVLIFHLTSVFTA